MDQQEKRCSQCRTKLPAGHHSRMCANCDAPPVESPSFGAFDDVGSIDLGDSFSGGGGDFGGGGASGSWD